MNKKVNGVVFSLIPLFCCIIYALLQGTTIWKINPYAVQLPQWCDEMYYYLQIESMAKHGNPMGYFGYNESCASVGTLGAWSVFTMYPYILLSKVFGASPLNMIYFNIFYIIVAFGVFYHLAKPNTNQRIKIALMFASVPLFTRYLLSGMTEALFFSAMIVLAGFAVVFQKGEYTRKSLFVCYMIIIYFSLGRPYILAFSLIPLYYHWKMNWKESILTFVAAIIMFGSAYIFFVQPRCASYLETVVDLSIVSVLFKEGLLEFIKKIVYVLTSDGKILLQHFSTNVLEVIIPYQILGVLLFLLIMSCIYGVIKEKKNKNGEVINGLLSIIITISILIAMILLYVEYTSARHMVSIALFLLFMVAMYFETNRQVLTALSICILCLFGWKNVTSLDIIYKLPTSTDEFETLPIMEDALKLENAFEVSPDNSIWDNTVAYEYSVINMNYCYFLPDYLGVNICDSNYISNNYETLKCKYLMVENIKEKIPLYMAAGWEILVEGKDFCLLSHN